MRAPVVQAELEHRRAVPGAGVVDEDVDAAERVRQLVDRGGPADVRLEVHPARLGADAVALALGERLARVLLVAVPGDPDVEAALGEQDGGGAADAGVAPGDDGDWHGPGLSGPPPGGNAAATAARRRRAAVGGRRVSSGGAAAAGAPRPPAQLHDPVLMDTPLALDRATPADLAARREAEQRGDAVPRLPRRRGRRSRSSRSTPAAGSLTLGRRAEADISLPWDPEVSRLHAELECKAGEWLICDDGFSQNGTFVNGLRIHGRRRLADGDLLRLGQTTFAFCDPSEGGSGITMAPGDLGAAPKFSEQQQRILRVLCRPLMGDGEGIKPATDAEIAAETGIAEETVANELDHLGRSFGLQDMPPTTAGRRSRCSRCAPGS